MATRGALLTAATVLHVTRPLALFNHGARNLRGSSTRFYQNAEERMQDRTNTWRRQEGLCLICGQPVAAPLYRQGVSGRVMTVVSDDNSDDGGEAVVAAIDSDGRLLTQECPVRLSLLRFNALGEFHAAHILDDYTLPETSRSKTASLRNEFAKYETHIRETNRQAIDLFKQKVLASTPDAMRRYAEAAALGKRVIGDLTICSCKRCNLAMNRISAHATAVYRCFSVTRDSDVVYLEDMRAALATNAKKVIQQMAFYFNPVYAGNTVTDWVVKSEDQLLTDGTLWRCIAHLGEWGAASAGGGVRARCIATFHAAHYIYLTNSSLRSSDVDFTAWYTHVWRPFYMTQYPTPNTFFGMRQTEVARAFDFSLKEGKRWESTLRAMLARHGDDLDAQIAAHADTLLNKLARHEDALAAAAVVDERGLLEFVCGGARVPSTNVTKIQRWLSFFRYNLDGCFGAAFLTRQIGALQTDLGRSLLRTSVTSRAPVQEGVDVDAWLAQPLAKLSL
jgi:hypothetical protein